ncbi:hypothetical protein GCM10023116_01850 [Kistimonas scapharcae]|uniref:Internal virion protein C n=1 Tax=Kistimonas scapharcae TaxID=1036133 RepID=A0ABP8UVJ5_9GAMM
MNWVQLNNGLGRATSTAKDIMDYKLRRDTLDEQKRQFDQNYKLGQRKTDLDEDRVRLAQEMYSDKQTEERRKRNLEQWQNLTLKAQEQALVSMEAGEISRPEEFWKTDKAAPLVEAAAQLHLGDSIKNLKMKRRGDGGYDAYDGDKLLQSLPVGFTQKRIAAYNIKNGLPDLLSSIGVEARVTREGKVAVRDARTGGEASPEQMQQVQQLSQELTEKTGIPLAEAMQADEKADAERLLGTPATTEPTPDNKQSALGMVQGGLARDAAQTQKYLLNPGSIPKDRPKGKAGAYSQLVHSNIAGAGVNGELPTVDEVKKLAYTAKEEIGEFAGKVGLMQKMGSALDTATRYTMPGQRFVGDVIDGSREASGSVAKKLGSGLRNAVGNMKETVTAPVKAVGKAVGEAADDFLAGFKGTPEKMAEQPQEAIDKVKEVTTESGKTVMVPKSDKMLGAMISHKTTGNDVKAALFMTRAMQAGGKDAYNDSTIQQIYQNLKANGVGADTAKDTLAWLKYRDGLAKDQRAQADKRAKDNNEYFDLLADSFDEDSLPRYGFNNKADAKLNILDSLAKGKAMLATAGIETDYRRMNDVQRTRVGESLRLMMRLNNREEGGFLGFGTERSDTRGQLHKSVIPSQIFAADQWLSMPEAQQQQYLENYGTTSAAIKALAERARKEYNNDLDNAKDR